MQGYNQTHTKENMMDALRRNRRMGLKRTNTSKEIKTNNDISFLEWYVFNTIGTTPKKFVGNLETQYYAEQNWRDRRQRNVEFIRGRHFGEAVYDAEIQKYVTQWQYLRRRNIPPLTYNLVSKFSRSLTGQFREINTGNIVKCDSKDDRGTELANGLTVCLDRIKKANKARSKDAFNFKEMQISGRPVYKNMWGLISNSKKPDIKFRVVNSSKFMVNPGVVDYDGDNLHTLTEIHDGSLNDIISNFANGDYEKGMTIKEAYNSYQGNELLQSTYSSQSFDGSQLRNNTFHYQGVGNSAYRYYETWTQLADYEAITFDPLDGVGTSTAHKFKDPNKVKKEIEAENDWRRENLEGTAPEEEWIIEYKADFVKRWYALFLTPWGSVLDVRESPYKSGLHPYTFTPPDINGEMWGLVEEILSAQLSMDRQILQADAVISNASKGTWLIPDTAVPDDFSNKEYIRELKKVDGAVIYKVKEGFEDQVPKQIYANSANVGNQIQQMIQLYSGLVDEISGNYGAAQGQPGAASKTATAYALETQNAGVNIKDTMENYLTMLVERDDKILQFILEGYTRQDYLRITGEDIDPAELKLFEFHVEQSKGTNSPGHRLALEQELLQLVYNGLLPFEAFLEVSTNPVMAQAKQKMDELKKAQAEQEQAALAQGKQLPEQMPQ
jgi:hypothetical protein